MSFIWNLFFTFTRLRNSETQSFNYLIEMMFSTFFNFLYLHKSFRTFLLQLFHKSPKEVEVTFFGYFFFVGRKILTLRYKEQKRWPKKGFVFYLMQLLKIQNGIILIENVWYHCNKILLNKVTVLHNINNEIAGLGSILFYQSIQSSLDFTILLVNNTCKVHVKSRYNLKLRLFI